MTKSRHGRKRTSFLPSNIDKQCDEEEQSQTESEVTKQEERIPRAALQLIRAVRWNTAFLNMDLDLPAKHWSRSP